MGQKGADDFDDKKAYQAQEKGVLFVSVQRVDSESCSQTNITL